MLFALLVVPFTGLAGGSAHAAPPDQTPFLTWNMQGASTNGVNLWTDYLPRIFTGAPSNVVMLQEVGPGVPAGATVLPNPPGTVGNSLVTYANWHTTQRPSEWYMVFLQTNDPNAPGGRVNTIVMSTTPVDAAMVVDNPHSTNIGRPAIGIRQGDDWYFSYHALSGGGGDAVGMLGAIRGAVAAAQPQGTWYEWTVGADFNTPPNNLAGRADFGRIPTTPSGNRPSVVASGAPTHRSPDGSMRELDYAVTTTGHGSFQASVQPNQGGSDHNPVHVVPVPPPATTLPQLASMPVGGYGMDGANVQLDPVSYSGMRGPLRNCMTGMVAHQTRCPYRSRAAARASAQDAGTPSFDYVGPARGGTVAGDDNEEETFPGQSIDQLRQHLTGDLRTYKPNVVLLQVDVANDLANDSALTVTQEANQLRDLLDQIYYDLPNTTVLVGDPVPSRTPAVQDQMYTGSASYLAQSSAVIASALTAGHRIRQVPLDFDHDVSYVDTAQSADGVPNYKGYQAMTDSYGAQLINLWQAGTIVAPDAVVVNPVDLVVDGSGSDDTGSSTDPPIAPPLRVMVVGDSMSQGMEGDATWRYRLWQWFRDQHVDVDFVGPYRGTKQPPAALGPAGPPPIQGEVENPSADNLPVTGAYAQGVPTGFDSDHFAVWGRQAAQDKNLIKPMVAEYRPDLVLFGIGFNDMGWFISDAPGTLDSMKTLVDQARAAKANVHFAVANVPQRLFIKGRQDLVDKTTQYNAMLKEAIPSWSTGVSPVKLVDWAGSYSCAPSACTAGYDGLHPSALGEYQIASAFEHTLHDGYGIGQSVPGIPTTIPTRPISPVSGLTAQSVPSGVKVSWNPVFGARGYTVRYRIAGTTEWSQAHAATNRYDTTWTQDGWTWEYQVRTDNGGDGESGYSPTVTATAHPETAAPPGNIITLPDAHGLNVKWQAPTGPHTDSIDRYEIITWDKDTPGAYISSTAVRGTTVQIDHLISGHHYLVAVATWNRAGGGMPAIARPVTVDAGKPPVPTNVTIKSTDATTVQLNWQGSPDAAGYRVWTRDLRKPYEAYKTDESVSDTPDRQIAFLFPGNWNFEFCITAINGEMETDRSTCVSLPPPAPSNGGVTPPSTSSHHAPAPAGESLLTNGQLAEPQRNSVAAMPTG
ncbi:GDSL-type esterase/lipase family protein [Streptomyces sp. NPDC091267]|uniref:GDSL-type esterase/lipase family protein n=1 Tax=Streptomyces sp. NPDC091267 TaxID=3155195 RepID=UPI00343ABD9D